MKKLNISKLAVIIFFILSTLLLFSCGNESENTNMQSDNTGSFSGGLKWPPGTPVIEDNRINARAIDCTQADVRTVRLTFYDENNNFLIDDEWACSIHAGTVSNIPVGTNRTLIATGEDSDGNVRYRGEMPSITISSGVTTQGGEIEMILVGGNNLVWGVGEWGKDEFTSSN